MSYKQDLALFSELVNASITCDFQKCREKLKLIRQDSSHFTAITLLLEAVDRKNLTREKFLERLTSIIDAYRYYNSCLLNEVLIQVPPKKSPVNVLIVAYCYQIARDPEQDDPSSLEINSKMDKEFMKDIDIDTLKQLINEAKKINIPRLVSVATKKLREHIENMASEELSEEIKKEIPDISIKKKEVDPKLKEILTVSLLNVCKQERIDLEMMKKLIDKGADFKDREIIKFCTFSERELEALKLLFSYGLTASYDNYFVLSQVSNHKELLKWVIDQL